MPVTYALDRDIGLVRTRCKGNVTFAEVIAHFRELEHDDSLPRRLNVLLDLTELDSVPDSEQLRTVADEVEHLKAKVRWGACAIAARRDVVFGMSRMFQVFAEAHFAQSNVFRRLDQAERWLALQTGPPE